MTDLHTINAMDVETFVARFGDVAEHSPWVARAAAGQRPFHSRGEMAAAFTRVLDAASSEEQLQVLCAHPDLGARLAVAEGLSEDSAREQAGAGLSRLGREEFEMFSDLNTRYRERNGFPFIFAVRGATREAILEAFRQRVRANRESELRTALENVSRIMGFRIEDRVSE